MAKKEHIVRNSGEKLHAMRRCGESELADVIPAFA
jgi:hypothetical protein